MSNIALWFTMMTTMCFKYPVNIQQCLSPWTWMPPYVQDFKRFKTGVYLDEPKPIKFGKNF